MHLLLRRHYMNQIAGDKLTQMAAKHWSEAARAKGEAPAFEPAIVEQVYRQELGGGRRKPPLLKRVMLLEVRAAQHSTAWLGRGRVRELCILHCLGLPRSGKGRAEHIMQHSFGACSIRAGQRGAVCSAQEVEAKCCWHSAAFVITG